MLTSKERAYLRGEANNIQANYQIGKGGITDALCKSLSEALEANELIKADPAYGKIVCRCEQITEGEIIRALTENPPANDVDGVKRRTRAGMGRCQGGFCQPFVVDLIAKVKGIELNEVTKNGKGFELLVGKTK